MSDLKTFIFLLEEELAKLDEEAERGIEDPVWLFERTAKVARTAIDELKKRA